MINPTLAYFVCFFFSEFAHEINLSTCEANQTRIHKLPVIFTVHGTGRKQKASENTSIADSCDLAISVDLLSKEQELIIDLVIPKQSLPGLNISVSFSRHDAAQNVTLFTSDDPDLTTSICLTSHDGVMALRVLYQVTSEIIEVEKLLYLKGMCLYVKQKIRFSISYILICKFSVSKVFKCT